MSYMILDRDHCKLVLSSPRDLGGGDANTTPAKIGFIRGSRNFSQEGRGRGGKGPNDK